jgi:hypothetical protein
MNPDRVILVIVLTILIVIGANGILYLSLRRGNETNMVNLTRKFLHNARNPWQEEDQSLQELSRLVGDLNSPKNAKSEDTPVNNELNQTQPGNPHAR